MYINEWRIKSLILSNSLIQVRWSVLKCSGLLTITILQYTYDFTIWSIWPFCQSRNLYREWKHEQTLIKLKETVAMIEVKRYGNTAVKNIYLHLTLNIVTVSIIGDPISFILLDHMLKKRSSYINRKLWQRYMLL